MNNREMINAWFDLPTHTQFAIARDLKFTPFEWEADNTTAFVQWFREARERGQLEQLRERIEKETP